MTPTMWNLINMWHRIIPACNWMTSETSYENIKTGPEVMNSCNFTRINISCSRKEWEFLSMERFSSWWTTWLALALSQYQQSVSKLVKTFNENCPSSAIQHIGSHPPLLSADFQPHPSHHGNATQLIPIRLDWYTHSYTPNTLQPLPKLVSCYWLPESPHPWPQVSVLFIQPLRRLFGFFHTGFSAYTVWMLCMLLSISADGRTSQVHSR